MGEQYYTAQPSSPSDRGEVVLSLPGRQLTLTTDRGVFARDEVDAGTRILLRDAPEPATTVGRALDLGCGYGPIACSMAVRWPEAEIWAIDVNERARDLCRANAATHELTNIRVAAPDDLDPGLLFDVIWSNPPIRIGKPALRDLLTRWLDRLDQDGGAVLVVQKHLGSDSLQRWLISQGWNTERVASRQGYRVLTVQRQR